MSIIRVLPAEIVGRIAAGEVIERPASVVKELVENAIDAGATRIRVNAEQGGQRMLQVIDNGCGMDRDDALLCLETHATSKITRDGDVGQIHTLGFRGEALPSIASVSRFLLQTRQADSVTGTEVTVDFGTIRDVRECGCAPGTNIRVGQLFANLPARRRFLKGPDTEDGHIEEMLLMLALSRPELSLSLTLNGREQLRANTCTQLGERVAMLLGQDTFAAMLPVDYEENGVFVRGFVSRPGFTRSSRREQRVFINGRAAAAETVYFAIRDAFDTLVMKGRYPGAVLYIDLAPERVDVNIHPAKREVRFRDPREIGKIIAAAIRRALRSMPGGSEEAIDLSSSPAAALPPAMPINAPRQVSLPMATTGSGTATHHAFPPDNNAPDDGDTDNAGSTGTAPFPPAPPTAASPYPAAPTATAASFPPPPPTIATPFPPVPAPPPAPTPYHPTAPTPSPNTTPATPQAGQPAFPSAIHPAIPGAQANPAHDASSMPGTPTTTRPGSPPTTCGPTTPTTPGTQTNSVGTGTTTTGTTTAAVPSAGPRPAPPVNKDLAQLRLCGRLGRRYVLAEAPTGLVVVDLQAAHQRILFERLLAAMNDQRQTRQQLLLPVTLNLSLEEARFLRREIGHFDTLGFTIEPFGGTTFLITAVPPAYPNQDIAKALRDILDDLRQSSVTNRQSAIHIAQAACRHAHRGKEELSELEIRALLDGLARSTMPYACPNGHPTMVHITYSELDKRFQG
ncbi:MAG: DNA mismatch repair endonuclease MutL [Lentisphaeria bacterium]|nr:DNA mismatch repair endonuclease MutL [Lentisphaeria bacterium]